MLRSSVRGLMFALALVLSAAGTALGQSTTVIVLRHAEKVDESRDPQLSAAGEARAAALAEALADAGVSAIITTQFERTRRTAAPLAERLGITPIVVAATDGNHARDVAARARDLAPGTIVIVGHSNTVPAIIRALGGAEVGPMPDEAYDDLFVLAIDEAGTRVVRAKYGAGGS